VEVVWAGIGSQGVGIVQPIDKLDAQLRQLNIIFLMEDGVRRRADRVEVLKIQGLLDLHEHQSLQATSVH
jgi:hypothetical protein